MHLRELIDQALAALDRERQIFSGFGAAMDIIMNIGGDAFMAMQQAEGGAPPRLSGKVPDRILRTTDDIIHCFAECVALGNGADVPLDSPAVAEPMSRHFPRRKVIGGTGVQTANCLTYCGFTRVSTHVPFLAPEIQALLHPTIKLYGNNEYFRRIRPDLTSFAGIHYILDYAAGVGVDTEQGVVRAPRPDRLILGGNPYNANLRIAPAFIELLRDRHPGSALIVAGLSAPKRYEDFLDLVDDLVLLLDGYRRHNPSDVFVHMEEGHHAIQVEERRRVIIDRLWPRLDSIGMNEAEYATLCRFLGLDSPDVWRNLLAMASRHGFNRVCLHTADTNRSVTRMAAHKERKALAMGVVTASARAHYGNFADMDGINAMLKTAEPIARGAVVPEPIILEDAYTGVEVPTLKGLSVHSSIGLGDAFTAGTTALL